MRTVPVVLLSAAALVGNLRAAECESPRERVAWARERMYPGATEAQLKHLWSGLKMATGNCPTDGELWYLRSLVEAKLNTRETDRAPKKRLEEYPVSAAIRDFNPLEAGGPGQTTKRPISPYVHDKWALLVGIQEFKDPNIPRLQFAASDAESLAKVLTGPVGRFNPSHVKVLTNERATTTAIKTALGEIRAQAKEDDLVLVFISSHGMSGAEDVTGVSFVITGDTDITADEQNHTSAAAKLYGTALPMGELSDFSRMLKAQRFVLMLDTCFSGGAIAPPVIAQPKKIKPLADKPMDAFTGSLHGMESGVGRALIAASKSSERSWESPKFLHGYFTKFLLEALEQHDGMDNLKTIFSYVRERVSATVSADVGQSQTPVFDATEKADEIILGVTPRS